jgi:citrate lyase subunit beta/citryl-CoA lyase
MKPVDLCRTWLFLPGADKDVLMAAPGRGADVLIQDLEDFTPPELRPAARALSSDIYRAWKEAGCVAGVRVNRLQEDGQKDLAAVMGAAPDIVLLPMVDEPAEMVALEDAVALHEASHGIPVGTIKLVPLIETARGLVQTGAIVSASPRIEAALLAAEDLAKDLGAERGRDGIELDYARQRFLVECRAVGVIPIDRPYTWDDIDGAVADTERGRRLGYKAKCLVQPDHAQAINRVLTPSSEAVARALQIIEAFEAARARGQARALVDGDLVEVPGYLSAKRTYDRAKALGVV